MPQLTEQQQREIGLALLERYSSLIQLRSELKRAFMGDSATPTVAYLEEYTKTVDAGYRSVLEQPEVQHWILAEYWHLFGEVQEISETDMVQLIDALHLAPIMLAEKIVDSE